MRHSELQGAHGVKKTNSTVQVEAGPGMRALNNTPQRGENDPRDPLYASFLPSLVSDFQAIAH